MKRHPRSVPYDTYLFKSLRNREDAIHYLNAAVELALKENEPELVLLALYNVAQAQGIKKTAKMAGVHRVSLHRMLTKGGNPEWKSMFRLISALRLGFEFKINLPKAA